MPKLPIQFVGHRFERKQTCRTCKASYDDVVATHAKGGMRAAICPDYGPQDPAEREAWLSLTLARLIESEERDRRDGRGPGHHKDHVH